MELHCFRYPSLQIELEYINEAELEHELHPFQDDNIQPEDMKDDHKELIFYLYLRDYSSLQLAALRNKSDRNIRGVRSTILGQIEKKVLMILADRQIEAFSFTMEEMNFLARHEAEIPATLEKLDKEKLALLKEIGVTVRKITREQEKIPKEKAKIEKERQ